MLRNAKSRLIDPKAIRDYHIKFEVNTRFSYVRRSDDSDYIVQIVGSIHHEPTDEDGELIGEAKQVGTVIAMLIQCGRMLNDYYPEGYEDCDAISGELEKFGALIFNASDRGDLFSDWYRKQQDEGEIGHGFDVLVLNRAELSEQHRGKDVGLTALWRTIETFGSDCGLILCDPFPLQFAGKGDDPGFERALKKLRVYYRRLGFEAIPNSTIMMLKGGYQKPPLWAELEEVQRERDRELKRLRKKSGAK